MGGIDLGVESMLAASGMLAAWLYVFRQSTTAVSIILTLAFGAAVGVIAGLLVSRARVPSFIVTLGTYWGFRGVALLFNGGNYISPDAVQPSRSFGFSWIAGTVGGFPTTHHCDDSSSRCRAGAPVPDTAGDLDQGDRFQRGSGSCRRE